MILLRRAAAVLLRLAAYPDTYGAAKLALELTEACAKPVPTRLLCPQCGSVHIDIGIWALPDHAHSIHRCAYCANLWEPYPHPTVGMDWRS